MMRLSDIPQPWRRLGQGARIFVPAALIMLLAATGCRQATPPVASPETARNVRILPLQPGTIREYFEVSGPVMPVRGTNLSAEESGPVVVLNTPKGAAVVAGQILVELDRDILKAEMDAAEAVLATQSYNVDKVRQLREAGKVSRIELLTAESTYAQAEATAAVAAKRYRRAAIRAPFDGVLADRFVELGQLVGPGQVVARVLDPYTLKLVAYLTEEQVGWVPVGAPASVRLGDDGDVVTGRVAWVGFEADRQTGKFKVEIELPNPELRLRSGVIGRARLGKNTLEGVLTIPRDAIVSGPAGETAYVVHNRRAVARLLTLGADQGVMVQVLKGLAPGDSLVVRGQREVREGSLVAVTEVAARADGSLAGDPAAVTGAGVGSRVPAAERAAGAAQ